MPGAIYIAGPTASGKSEVALQLAERIGGEIISVDSMQVYKGMDIGSAKPSAADRARVPHHLIDVVEITEPFDAARFVALARQAEAEIFARGKLPIFCGGTGLYFNALLGGLSESPPDPAVRAELEATPLGILLQELRQRDPATFDRIDRSNPRRVIRALEILRSGRAKPAWKSSQPGHWFGLEWPRPELNRRIEARVDWMFQNGLVAETAALLARGLEKNRTAMQAIGYRQVVEHLRGERDLPATAALVKQKTRQYAKRQVTWFRHKLILQRIEAGQRPVSAIADDILRRCEL